MLKQSPPQRVALQEVPVPYNAESFLSSGDADIDLVWVGNEPQVLLLPALRGLPVNLRSRAGAYSRQDHVPPFASLTLHDGADGHAADALFQEALVDLGHLGVVGAQDGDALRQDGAI